MQQHGLPTLGDDLSFDTIVPDATSTRHVAAAAFYHCLGELHVLRYYRDITEFHWAVLATKDLIRLRQPEPYGTLRIKIVL